MRRAVGRTAIWFVGDGGAAVDGLPKTPAGCWGRWGKRLDDVCLPFANSLRDELSARRQPWV